MSEIFVDTIRKTGGSLGTDIRIKNTSVYESDGGTSVTQNIVTAISKAWCFKVSNGTSLTSSFNFSSIDDDGTGDYGLNFTNPFSDVNYIPNQNIRGGIVAGNSDGHFAEVETCNTTSAECETWYGNASTNATFLDWEVRHLFHGDLA
jgi:hypothetical protein